MHSTIVNSGTMHFELKQTIPAPPPPPPSTCIGKLSIRVCILYKIHATQRKERLSELIGKTWFISTGWSRHRYRHHEAFANIVEHPLPVANIAVIHSAVAYREKNNNQIVKTSLRHWLKIHIGS